MNYDTFKAKYYGQSVSFDGIEANRGQCVQPVALYSQGLTGTVLWRNAADWWTYYAGTPFATKWDKIPNNPNDPNQVPRRGDIVVFNYSLPGSGGYGHIDIFDRLINANSWVGLDSNWGGKTLHEVTHNWGYVLGWFTPKVASPAPAPQPTPQGGDEVINTSDEAVKMYKMLRPNGSPSQAEIDISAGKRSYKNFVNDAQAEVNARDASLREQAQHLQDMQNTINQLNQNLTNVAGDNTATKAQLQETLAKAAELTTELEAANNKIKDSQNQPVIPPQLNDKLDLGFFKKLWQLIFKKGK